MSAIRGNGKHISLENPSLRFSEKSVSSGFFSLSDQRIHVIAWNILGGIALIGAVAGVTALSMQVISLTSGLMIIPFALLAGYAFWQSNYIDDIDSNPQVDRLRNEASQMDLSQLEAKYGAKWWEVVFKFKLLSPVQFSSQYQKMVGDRSFKQIVECYEEVDRSAHVFNRGGKLSHYTIPHPKEWISKWKEEVAKASFSQIFEICSLETLKKYQLLDLSELSKIERLVRLDLLTKKEFDKSSEPFQESYKKKVVCVEWLRGGSFKQAEQIYSQGKTAERLLDFDLPFLKRQAEIINKRSLCVLEAKRICKQQHEILTQDGSVSYNRLSPQAKKSYDNANEVLKFKEAEANAVFDREQSEWDAGYGEVKRAAELADLEALHERDQKEEGGKRICERAIAVVRQELNQKLRPFQERLEAFERDLKILFQ